MMQPKTTLVSLDIIFLTYPPVPLLLFLLLFLKLDSSPPLNSLNVCLSGTLCTVFLSNFVVLIFNDVLHNYTFFYPPFCHSSCHQCSWRWVSWSFVCSLRSFRVYFSVSLLLDICLWSRCVMFAHSWDFPYRCCRTWWFSYRHLYDFSCSWLDYCHQY